MAYQQFNIHKVSQPLTCWFLVATDVFDIITGEWSENSPSLTVSPRSAIIVLNGNQLKHNQYIYILH